MSWSMSQCHTEKYSSGLWIHMRSPFTRKIRKIKKSFCSWPGQGGQFIDFIVVINVQDLVFYPAHRHSAAQSSPEYGICAFYGMTEGIGPQLFVIDRFREKGGNLPSCTDIGDYPSRTNHSISHTLRLLISGTIDHRNSLRKACLFGT